MTSLQLLAKACAQLGQRETAKRIRKSATTVNQILKQTYPKPEKILQIVDQTFAYLDSSEVQCPVLGEIHPKVCKRYGTMAVQGKVHQERLYMKVREHCLECSMNENKEKECGQSLDG